MPFPELASVSVGMVAISSSLLLPKASTTSCTSIAMTHTGQVIHYSTSPILQLGQRDAHARVFHQPGSVFACAWFCVLRA